MEKHYKFILENKSNVDQIWQLQPHFPVTIKPGDFKTYNYIIDTDRNISIGLLIDVGENQIATSVRRDEGEDSKFYLFPALHEIAIGTYTATVHIRSTFDGTNLNYANILTSAEVRI